MTKLLPLLFLSFALGILWYLYPTTTTPPISGAPPYLVTDDQPAIPEWLKDWKRPEGRVRVGLQVGHWKNEEVPQELHRLKGNTGATGAGLVEWEVNYAIAVEVKKLLETQGIAVDLLPATIPPQYFADVFVSIHADGSEKPEKSGYKAAAPLRDITGKANSLVHYVENAYQKATGMEKEPTITRNMTGYYAFGWWRFEHAIHPMTTAIILETGFLTSPKDRSIIVHNPKLSAQGISAGIVSYLKSQNLLSN